VLFCLALSLSAAGPARAQKAEDLKAAINASRQEAQSKKEKLSRLTHRERKLHGSLSGLEDEIKSLTKRVSSEEKKLQAIREEEQRVKDDYFALKKEQQAARERLDKLLNCIWPLRLQGLTSKLRGLSDWSGLDRRFTWLAAVYRQIDQDMRRMADQSRRLSINLAEQERLRLETQDRLDDVNAVKDKLLATKLALLAEIKKTRSLKLSAEEELDSVLSTIHTLNYQLKSLVNRRIGELKGYLPWPAKGEVVSGFNLRAKPPRHGLGLKLQKNAPVQSVFWGKVVHNNVLRGFGNVVIIYHGDDYYSLYAYLAESSVRMGQEVEKDEVIGRAGYYPKAHAYGLYFELRFHRKPINPSKWLSR
jgi:septal ring factor EnvC (AmiA/AmiB activator)